MPRRRVGAALDSPFTEWRAQPCVLARRPAGLRIREAADTAAGRLRGDPRDRLAKRLREACLRDVEVIEFEGEPVSLIDMWAGAPAVYLVDAVSSGGQPGTVYRFDATSETPRSRSSATAGPTGLASPTPGTGPCARLPAASAHRLRHRGGEFKAGTRLSA